MRVELYNDSLHQVWDTFCKEDCASNFQHSRKFLSYHGDRFKDASLLLLDEKKKVIGLFPAAFDNSNIKRVVSHPGATFGGLLYQGRKSVDQVFEMMSCISEWYRVQGVSELIYKTTPVHCQNQISVIDQYVLWRLNATLYQRDLWNILPLGKKRSLSKGRKWALNKALKNGITVKQEATEIAYKSFHTMLSSNLRDRHDSNPVHSCYELIQLGNIFPESISLWLAYDNMNNVCAGTWLFDFGNSTLHTQYIAANEIGRSLFAVDMLLEHLIKKSEEDGKKLFSFGASTESNGLIVNEGLFAFKAGFGVGSATQDFYHLSLI